jgi:hypothetical protein
VYHLRCVSFPGPEPPSLYLRLTVALETLTPNVTRDGSAVAIPPLVAIAQRTPASVRHFRSSQAPGNGRTSWERPRNGFSVPALYPFHKLGADFQSGFAEQRVWQEAAAHSDLFITPHCERDPDLFEGFAPGQSRTWW